jgi:large subunit ribosomal protein L18
MLKKVQNRIARATRVRARMSGTAEKPRLSVFRSNTHITVQAIDDTTGTTLFSASDMSAKKGTKTERAREVGTSIAKAMTAK